MKKEIDWSVLLLAAAYAVLIAVVYVCFRPEKPQQTTYTTEAEVRAAFAENFDAFDRVSYILWSHPEYFLDKYEKTDIWGMQDLSAEELEKNTGNGFFTEEEWAEFKSLCARVKPYEIIMQNPGSVNAVQWIYVVKRPNKNDYYSLNLYYVRPVDSLPAGEVDAAVEAKVQHLGRYNSLSPMEGREYWYSAVSNPEISE